MNEPTRDKSRQNYENPVPVPPHYTGERTAASHLPELRGSALLAGAEAPRAPLSGYLSFFLKTQAHYRKLGSGSFLGVVPWVFRNKEVVWRRLALAQRASWRISISGEMFALPRETSLIGK